MVTLSPLKSKQCIHSSINPPYIQQQVKKNPLIRPETRFHYDKEEIVVKYTDLCIHSIKKMSTLLLNRLIMNCTHILKTYNHTLFLKYNCTKY